MHVRRHGDAPSQSSLQARVLNTGPTHVLSLVPAPHLPVLPSAHNLSCIVPQTPQATRAQQPSHIIDVRPCAPHVPLLCVEPCMMSPPPACTYTLPCRACTLIFARVLHKAHLHNPSRVSAGKRTLSHPAKGSWRLISSMSIPHARCDTFMCVYGCETGLL